MKKKDKIECPRCREGWVVWLRILPQEQRACCCEACGVVWRDRASISADDGYSRMLFTVNRRFVHGATDFAEAGYVSRVAAVDATAPDINLPSLGPVDPDRKIICPLCQQDWVHRVRMTGMDHDVALCPECNAMWNEPGAIGVGPFDHLGTEIVVDWRGPLLRNG
jgi:hypothetical protein